jgi:hypothetical protein
MNSVPPPAFFIGWDVGGWNCDYNPASRDAIVILDTALTIVGRPRRSKLRKHLDAATDTRGGLNSLFKLCATNQAAGHSSITLAIDTPLGFSQDFLRLVTGLQPMGPVDTGVVYTKI